MFCRMAFNKLINQLSEEKVEYRAAVSLIKKYKLSYLRATRPDRHSREFMVLVNVQCTLQSFYKVPETHGHG